jgi:NAD(P)-dependent dehydrogenase (short-subunit alcohol dehydrogenase family)
LTIKYWPDLFKLDNRVVVVTGAGLIGSQVIKGLAEAGAKVIIGEINKQIGEKLEIEYKASNLDVIFKHLDITSEESIDALIKHCIQEFKKIDAWINTAYPHTENWNEKYELLDYKAFKENVEVHLGGYFITSIKAAEAMKKQGKGCIINFGSTYGVTAPDFSIYEGTDIMNELPYAAIKGGINMVTKYLATYYAKYNIRANVIAPGGVFDNQPEPFLTNYNKKVPLNRMAQVSDIVGPVIFLVSDAASYITGQILLVDGGWTAW